ncbi:MAG: hypothetical protein ACWA5R_04770 [bacterium]
MPQLTNYQLGLFFVGNATKRTSYQKTGLSNIENCTKPAQPALITIHQDRFNCFSGQRTLLISDSNFIQWCHIRTNKIHIKFLFFKTRTGFNQLEKYLFNFTLLFISLEEQP